LPANVKTCLAPVALEMAPGVVLLPAPLFARETSADPTEWMDRVATPEGAVRIGMAHGSVRGFGSLGEAAVPIDAGRRQSAGLDYLALGDWHGAKEIAPGVWYSGTPEPDSFADNGPGHTLVVRVQAAGATPEVTKVPTAQTRWVERRVALARLADIEPVEHEISTLGAAQRSTVLAMRLEGAIAASEAGHLDERIARLRAGLLALDIDRRRLRVMVGSGDVAQIDDAVLSLVAGRLAGSAANSETPEGRIAARAMRILLALAAPGPGGEGRA
jgi:DNA repair exonuclease SbcCD nuclease subunit